MSRTVVPTMIMFMLMLSLSARKNTARAQSDFAPIELDSNSPTSAELANVIGIWLPPHCPTNTTGLLVPNVQFTIMPSASEAIVVLTTPSNVLTMRLGMASDEGEENMLAFEWNPTLAELEGTSLGGVGVIIQIPDAQFQKFYTCCNISTQIFEGFTNLAEFQLGSGSDTQAILSSDTNVVNPSITISEDAKAVIERDLGFNDVVATSGSVLNLRGDIWGSLEGTLKAAITLKGSLQSGASSSSLTSGASLVTTTSDDCQKVQASDGATCMLAENADSLEVNAVLGADLALVDTGSRGTCVLRPVIAATSPPGSGSNGGSNGGSSVGSPDGSAGGSSGGSTGGSSGESASSGSATFATTTAASISALFFGLL